MVLTVQRFSDEIRLGVAIGPETHAGMGINGTQRLDITPVITTLREDPAFADHKVVLSLCRCDCEVDTVRDCMDLGLNAAYSMLLTKADKAELDGAANETGNSGPVLLADLQANPAPAPVPVVESRPRDTGRKPHYGRCAYCRGEEELMPVPGFMICKSCAIIELGCARNRTKPEPAHGDL